MLDWIALIILVIGALNWGVLGVSGLNLIAAAAAALKLGAIATKVAYIVIGLAALYVIGVGHAFRRVPTPSELIASRVVETTHGPVTCPPCP